MNVPPRIGYGNSPDGARRPKPLPVRRRRTVIDLTEDDEEAPPLQPGDAHAVRHPRTPIARLEAQPKVPLHNVHQQDPVHFDPYGQAAEVQIHPPNQPQLHDNLPVVQVQPRAPPPDFMPEYFQYLEDGDVDQAALQAMIDDQMPYLGPDQPRLINSEQAPVANPAPPESRDECLQTVLMLFPDICVDHVTELYQNVSKSSEALIAHILNKQDNGTSYPKAKDKLKTLKRKRQLDEDEEATRKYGAVDRIIPATAGGVRPYIRTILQQEFSLTPAHFIDATLSQSGYRLFSAYRVLEEAHRTYDSIEPPYNKIKKARKVEPHLEEAAVLAYLANPDADNEKVEVLKELQAARRIRKKADARRQEEREKEIEEEANTRRAEADGTMGECGCCFCDYPMNRMVHCDGEILHWFCRNCARMTAEVEIGKSKYELQCMSTDKCIAGFAMDQRVQFLDEKTRVALERNEQEANLRLAGIQNLASCPFCPFAAEYPPVEVDREFRCQAPDCEKVSCRLCKLESHIPKSCDEFAKENGLSIRRQIEEAMSAALIRKCNKCNTPFVKEEGCNKMTCTRNGCFNIQCYVCSKSCTYDHFNDPGRGGKLGNCPLFESVEQRHEEEVKKAEKEALDKVLAEHPEYTAEDLSINVSEDVKKDDERRKANDPRNPMARMEEMLQHRAGRRHAERAPRPAPVLFGRRMYGVPVLPHLQYPAAAVGNRAVAPAPIPPPGPPVPPAPPADLAAGFQGQLAERAFLFPDPPRVQFYEPPPRVPAPALLERIPQALNPPPVPQQPEFDNAYAPIDFEDFEDFMGLDIDDEEMQGIFAEDGFFF